MDTTTRNVLIFGALGVGAYVLWTRSRAPESNPGAPVKKSQPSFSAPTAEQVDAAAAAAAAGAGISG